MGLSWQVAHVIVRHGVEVVKKSLLVHFLTNFVEELLNTPVDGIAQDKWLSLFMRPMELEADRVGLMLQAAAGYSPGMQRSLGGSMCWGRL
uniref:Uncharacterized protein n=1 Tax=Oryza punctata TaxID=4537 RepID=A0A0E0K4Z8_ORYPU